MNFEYDSEIMSYNDSFEVVNYKNIVDFYEFKVVCDTEELNSIGLEFENLISDCYDDVVSKKSVIVAVKKNNDLIACLEISNKKYVSYEYGKNDGYLFVDDAYVVEDWGEKKNLKFDWITQKEIYELLRSGSDD